MGRGVAVLFILCGSGQALLKEALYVQFHNADRAAPVGSSELPRLKTFLGSSGKPQCGAGTARCELWL